ncbi:MAG: TolC family protein [Ekhidna sp.]|jgi:multidrug efflux system outer membrane protein
MNSYMNKWATLGLILLLSACKSISISTDKPLKEMPPDFEAYADTTNIANLSWREYFGDTTLVRLIEQAITDNPDLSIAQQRIEMARADVTFTKGMLLPVVDAAGFAGQARTAEFSVNWAGNEGGQFLSGDPLRPAYTDYFIGLQSSWEADVWGKLKNRKKAALSRFYASSEGKNWVVSNLVADMALTYYELLSLDENLEIIRETIALQENALEVVRAQKEAGKANKLAVEQFETQLLSLKGLEKETLQEIAVVEYRLNLLMGHYPKAIQRNSFAFEDSVALSVLPGVSSQLLVNRPDIRQAELDLMATKADVKAARAAFYPSLGITAGFGYNAFKPQFLFRSPESIAYNVFGDLTAPLFNRSAIKAEFNFNKANQVEAFYNYQKTLLEAYSEVSLEIRNIRNLQERYELKSNEVDVLTSSIETSSDLFKTGRASYLEVLITQQNTLQSRLELIDVREQLYYSKVKLYKALGGGWR